MDFSPDRACVLNRFVPEANPDRVTLNRFPPDLNRFPPELNRFENASFETMKNENASVRIHQGARRRFQSLLKLAGRARRVYTLGAPSHPVFGCPPVGSPQLPRLCTTFAPKPATYATAAIAVPAPQLTRALSAERAIWPPPPPNLHGAAAESSYGGSRRAQLRRQQRVSRAEAFGKGALAGAGRSAPCVVR